MRAIVIDPELEAWVWSDSPEVDRIIGWSARQSSVRAWLREQGFAFKQNGKPDRPKEALEKALRIVKKQRSSALYGQIAEKVSLSRCTDRSFVKLRQTLQEWFPKSSASASL